MRSRIYIDTDYPTFFVITMIELETPTFDDTLPATLSRIHNRFVFNYPLLF